MLFTNKISQLSKEQKSSGLVAYSSGNHAQAVAYASLQDNISAKIIMPNNAPKITIENNKVSRINLAPHDPALLLINHIRDESHRFAIKNHRHKRALKRNTSPLENIKGIGVNKRRALLNYFGRLQEIKNASIDELQKVIGINFKLATKIQETLIKN